MKILYVSSYLDEEYFDTIFNSATIKPIQNIQKFNKLFVDGLDANEKVDRIDVLSSAVVNRKIAKKLLWKGKNITINKTNFNYIPFINIKFIKQICVFLYCFFYVFIWCIQNKGEDCALISDGFYPIASTVSSFICKLFNVKVVTLYTDLPKFDVNDEVKESNIIRKFIKKIINVADGVNIKLSDSFILLTEAMNEVVNLKNKPYIVMEGLVDSKISIKIDETKRKKVFMYAGGLYEKYGVKILIDAFKKWNNKDYELWLCGGDGDLLDYINNLNNKNIKYLGVLPNNEVVKLEQECMLLINPRFTNHLYTKYSFPSKNMEYMLSGTPVLTTKLPGMPTEYNDYVFLIDDISEEGLIKDFNKIAKMSIKKINEFGKKSKEYVIKNKNNKKQAKRVINLLDKTETKIGFIKKNYNVLIGILSLFIFALGFLSYNISITKLSLLFYFINIFVLSLVNYKKYLLYNIFLISFFVFTMGQYFTRNVNADIMYYGFFNNVDVMKTMFVQLLCLIFSYESYSFISKRVFKKNINIRFNDNALKLFFKIVFSLFIITSISAILINIEMAISMFKYGYLSLYNNTYQSMFPSIVEILSKYYMIFMIFSLSLTKNKKYIIFIFILFFLVSITNLLTGMRYEFVYFIFFVIFYVLKYKIDSRKDYALFIRKGILLFIIIIPILIVFLNSYNSIRNKIEVKNKNVSYQIESFFAAQGRSVNVINYAMNYEKLFDNNKTSYVFGLFNNSIIEKANIIIEPDIAIKDIDDVNFGVKISKMVLGEKQFAAGNGLGSQFLAELYIEGSYIGIILYSILLGLLFSFCYKYSSSNFLINYFSYTLIYPALHLSRSVSFELFAPFVSTISLLFIFLLIIMHLSFNYIEKRKVS